MIIFGVELKPEDVPPLSPFVHFSRLQRQREVDNSQTRRRSSETHPTGSSMVRNESQHYLNKKMMTEFQQERQIRSTFQHR